MKEIILNINHIVSIKSGKEGSNSVVIKMIDGVRFFPFTTMEEVEKAVHSEIKIHDISNIQG